MEETRLFFVRHGETAWNAEGRIQGWLDSPLTEKGLDQARILAQRLRPLRPGVVYSSDLRRATKTAAILGETLGIEVRPDTRFREKCSGIFEGLTWSEAERDHPGEAALYRSGDPQYALPGAESKAGFHDRVVAGLVDFVAGPGAGLRVAVVTHGGVIQAVVRYILGIPPDVPRRFLLQNGGLLSVVLRSGQFWIESIGEPCSAEEADLAYDV